MSIPKKKIILATDNYPPRIDGIAKFVEMILPYLEEYTIEIIAPNYGAIPEHLKKYTIHHVNLQPFTIGDYRPAQLPSASALEAVKDCDLVFVQTFGPIGSAVTKTAHQYRKKIIAYVHSIEWQLVQKSMSPLNPLQLISVGLVKNHIKKMYGMCTAMIVPSNQIAELYKAHGIYTQSHVVHLGVDTHRFTPVNKTLAKKKLGINTKAFTVGYVGRIAREKSLLTLRNAFRKIHTSKILLIVGSGIPSLVKSLSDKDVIITGPQLDVVPYLQAMDVFVMPSLTETTCLAALEAMSCEIPIITTKVGNLKEYIVNKENGMFFPMQNDTVLALKLRYLIENPYERESMAKKAREIVLKEYDWEICAQNIRSILKKYIQ